MQKVKRYKSTLFNLTKRKFFSFLFYFLFLLCSFYVSTSSAVVLPDASSPLVLYHGPKNSLKDLLLQAVDQSKKSIYIECYAIDYPPLLKKIKAAVQRGVRVEIYFDPKASPHLENYFYSAEGSSQKGPMLKPYLGKALMHRKLFITDEEVVYMGSANFTEGSLLYHENVMIGIQNEVLAKYLKTPLPALPYKKQNAVLDGGFILETPQFRAQFFKLPEEKFAALSLLYKKLEAAKKTIDIAMFTFTHQKIANVLREKALSGVKVHMILDSKQKRLSEKLIPGLTTSGALISTYKTGQLFHHKWAFIDNKEWILGSVNWTKNGFSKNSELLVFFEIFDPVLSNEIESLWQECSGF